MKIGISYLATDLSVGPGEVARAAEEAGLEAFFVSENTHVPVDPAKGAEQRETKFVRNIDQFIALATAAAATSTILLGTSITLVTQRDPINVAKEAASIDHLSGGRLIFGIGAGARPEAARHHGTDFDHRFRVMRERVEAIKTIWTREEPEYHGRYVDFGPIFSWPKPAQKPHPPILIGGAGPNVLNRVLHYADGWLPNPAPELPRRVDELRDLFAAAGRERPIIQVNRAPQDPALIDSYARLGVDRVTFGIEPGPRDQVFEAIGALEPFIRTYNR